MKENMKNSGIAEELMAFIFHPRNMENGMIGDFQNIMNSLILNNIIIY